MKARPKNERTTEPRAKPRLVYTQAPVMFGRLIAEVDGGWRVAIGPNEREMKADACVDPELLREALANGARVLVDASEEPIIAGVIATQRSVRIDREGRVKAKVRSFEVDATDEVVMKTPGAFVRALPHEIEVYGERVLTRARNLAKIMAAMIKIN